MAVYDASLADRIPAGTDPDRVAELFIDWAAERSLDLYDAQEEAVLEILGGSHVVLATPTGSGKSLVAIAAHAAALARGDRCLSHSETHPVFAQQIPRAGPYPRPLCIRGPRL